MATHWLRLERKVNDKETLELRWRQAKQRAGDAYGISHTPSPLPATAGKCEATAASAIQGDTGIWPSKAQPATAKAVPLDFRTLLWLVPGSFVLGVAIVYLWPYLVGLVGGFLVILVVMLLGVWFFQNPLALLLILLFGNC